MFLGQRDGRTYKIFATLKDLCERTYKNKAGQFVDPRSEQIYNEMVARIEDRQT